MSFITKRERVFNEYDLFDLPARNEGKLKAYASCTDARAWSHFCSDKSEHLIEIIKRNNETVRPKYLPTDVIVNTLMAVKNSEIARLRRKIDEFEQMLAVYEQLDLTCDQKCEIADAHAAIKAANKELDDLCLDLDLSGFTEGIDSEAFETGKSRGDEPARYRIEETTRSTGVETGNSGDEYIEKENLGVENKANQAGEPSCPCDASVSVHDPRIEEMQETIIYKDAKLNAMQNTIAVMENDVCEPYCLYAHIYTALEKIFGILCQNAKYKQYLDLLTAGKDTRCIDIKGRILYKMKVLEKFCLALIAPCSQDFSPSDQDCSCYQASVVTRVETAFALTSAESHKPTEEVKRAQLIADIMENDEMKEILNKETTSSKLDDDRTDDGSVVDNYSIDNENLNRLKVLQVNYDDLMVCFENLKHEKDCLQVRCRKYEDVEKEFENLRCQLREYNSLWNEKEYYKRRSEDLDSLKEQYLLLTDETTNLETQLKAEIEINNIKSNTIDDLRNENISLEKKINEASIAFEKERNTLQCTLKETECKVMCQEQQIKSLSLQMDRLLEQDHNKEVSLTDNTSQSIVLIDEIDSLKDQVKNLRDALLYNEEEKKNIQEGFENQLQVINNLRMEIEDWKSMYDKLLQKNEYLEKCNESFRNEIHKVVDENRSLCQDVEEKANAIKNLINVITNKSQEVNKLLEEKEENKNENKCLLQQVHKLQDSYNESLRSLEMERQDVLGSLQLAQQESQELLNEVRDYSDLKEKHEILSKSLENEVNNNNDLNNILKNTIDENKRLQMDLAYREENNAVLSQEIQKLREEKSSDVININVLLDENAQYKKSLDVTKKESRIMEGKILELKNSLQHLQSLKASHDKLIQRNDLLESELRAKEQDINNAMNSIQLCKKESETLMDKLHQSEKLKEDLFNLSSAYQRLMSEKHLLQKELADKNKNLTKLQHSLNNLKSENEILLQKSGLADVLEKESFNLKKAYDELLAEKNILQNDFDNKAEEINRLYNTLEAKIEENREILNETKALRENQLRTTSELTDLKNENLATKTALKAFEKQSEDLEREYGKLKRIHDEIISEKDRLQAELSSRILDLNKMEKENIELNRENQNFLKHSEDLEKALIDARSQLVPELSSQQLSSYTNLIKEIEEMKKEKIVNQKKIRDLLNKLDETESLISNLSEDILARDDKIAILQNHINELEDEVRRLHECLSQVVDTGEQIKDHSYEINESFKKIDAHHSKATHNMKMELIKLQNENNKLEDQLSITKLKSDDSIRDRHKYKLQIVQLQNEKEIIVTDIKELELFSVGDSDLSPKHCSVEDIITSLARIRKYLDTKNAKSDTLEQTLLKVQTSSQLLLSKAGAAKKIEEQEKQKIINEKEEAVKDRISMEKQLNDLKEKLENQLLHDKNITKDLEAEILNQKLITDKINKSTQNYVLKLEEEMESLRNLYQNALEKINELQDKMKTMKIQNDDNASNLKIMNLEFEKKVNEVACLQKQIKELKERSTQDFGVQVWLTDNHRNMSSQTIKLDDEVYTQRTFSDEFKSTTSKNNVPIPPSNLMSAKDDNKKNQSLSQTDLSRNRVQILTANIEPTFDFVKNSYLNYKLSRLSQGRLEHYSISSIHENLDLSLEDRLHSLNIFEPASVNYVSESHENYEESVSPDSRLIDIYNRHSPHTISLKYNNKTKNQNDPQTKSIKEQELSNHSYETESNNISRSVAEESVDKDLFMIYKDSESNQEDKKYDDIQPWSVNQYPEILVERVTVQSNNKKTKNLLDIKDETDYFPESHYNDFKKEFNLNVDKPKLQVSLPRVETGSPSIVTNSDFDKKSLDSYTLAIYPSLKEIDKNKQNKHEQKTKNKHIDSFNDIKDSLDKAKHMQNREEQIFELNIQDIIDQENIKQNKKNNKDQSDKEVTYAHNNDYKSIRYDNESHHNLPRVGADVLLIKDVSESEQFTETTPKDNNFGLQYILDSVQHETNPHSSHSKYDHVKGLRISRSDERFNQVKYPERRDSSPSTLSPVKVSSIEYGTVSSISPSKFSDKSQPKSLVERSIMVKTDEAEDYESKIRYLTNTLENIEKDYKKKIDAIKVQYDSNIKSIINEHNEGVKSIQGLHEETLQDILKIHENEVENLRSMSIEAMRKADKLQKENRSLKIKIKDCSCTILDEEPVKMSTTEVKRRKSKSRSGITTLTKTNVEAFNVKPKPRSHGPCTCSLDVNISDTIRNIFEQVDVEQRKLAEQAYVKYIANKILNNNVEALDAQELSFLHLKVCRIWKSKLSKEEVLQKRIDSLENELMNKQKNAQEHIAELDRKVAEERRRLQEIREAVYRVPGVTPEVQETGSRVKMTPPMPPPPTAEKDVTCNCSSGPCTLHVTERRSAGDLVAEMSSAAQRPRRIRNDNHRAVLAKLDVDERKEKKLYQDEPPTRLRRNTFHERGPLRPHKK